MFSFDESSIAELIPLLAVSGGISANECVAIQWIIAQHFDRTIAGVGLDLGTHEGRSALVAMMAIKRFADLPPNFRFHGVDTSYSEIPGLFEKVFKRLYELAPFADLHMGTSAQLLDGFVLLPETKISYCFLDAGNHERPLLDKEIALIKPRLVSGSLVLFHDVDNQFIAPGLVMRELIDSGEFEPLPIPWHAISEVVNRSELSKDEMCWAKYNDSPGEFVGAIRKI